ncbi:MAG: DUF2341 domain-containing protein, partial [Lentisphaerae bacterium]|nr:DUF2341 domain-containing protein [Lentisphaerota bacterium]
MKKTYRFRSLVLFLIFLVTVSTLIAEDLSLWPKRMPITYSGYDKEETLINFPAMIVLDETDVGVGFSYDDFLSPPYGDLRFTAEDKETPLDFEVESWNLDGKSYIWVKIPELTQDTKIYALWGRPGVTAPACTTDGSVWSEDYLGVWHMKNVAGVTIEDSTSNDFHGMKMLPSLPNEVDAVVGKGQLFDQNIVDLTGLVDDSGIYTISMWINGSKKSDWMYPFGIGTGCILVGWGAGPSIGIYDGVNWRNFGATPELDIWHHLAFLCDTNKVSMYLNGKLQGSNSSYVNNPIGGSVALGSSHSKTSHFFPGMLDEVRVSTAIRSSNWIWASWENQRVDGCLVEYKNPETQELPHITNARGATNVIATAACLNGTLVSSGISATAITLFWGNTDGENNSDNWQFSNTWEVVQSPGDFSHEITNLTVDSTYYYRFMAENNAGRTWAPETSVFVTSEVWLEKISDAQFSGLIPGEVKVHRGTVSTEPLDVYYTIKGSALPGLEYEEVSGVVTIPADETFATLNIMPLPTKVMPKKKTVELELFSSYVL